MYKLQLNIDASGNLKPSNMVVKDGRLWVPFDPANTDYQQYLKWLEEGNVPTPAEEQQ